MSEGAKVSRALPLPILERFTSISSEIISVGVTATPIPAAALDYRQGILVQNNDPGAAIVYLGDSDVVAATTAHGGYQLGPGDAVYLSLDGSCVLYAIADTATTPVFTMEFA